MFRDGSEMDRLYFQGARAASRWVSVAADGGHTPVRGLPRGEPGRASQPAGRVSTQQSPPQPDFQGGFLSEIARGSSGATNDQWRNSGGRKGATVLKSYA